MSNTYFFIKIILFFIFTWNKFPQFSFESISICYLQSAPISCSTDHNIVILNARIGYLPYLDKQNYNKTTWCHKSDSYYNISSRGCVKSLRRVISSRCTGKKDCSVSAIPSQYFLGEYKLCDAYHSFINEMSFYLEYECVQKELFFQPNVMDNIHLIGGYITSVGYSQKKSQEYENYKELGKIYRDSNSLPINIFFKPNLLFDGKVPDYFLFQLQILENSISLSNQSSVDQTCQIGELYSRDYYAFIPTNTTSNERGRNELVLCSSNSDMVGQTFGPITANSINITVNTNFTSFNEKVLLIKFTTILCPLIFIDNAKVIYDHVVETYTELSVFAIATITCKSGFFLLSKSNNTKRISTTTFQCNHVSGLWNSWQTSEKCVTSLPLPSALSILRSTTTVTATLQKRTYSTSQVPLVVSSTITSRNFTNISNANIIIPNMSTLSFTRSLTKYLVSMFIIIFIFIIVSFLLWKFRSKMKCMVPFLIWYSKLRFRNDTIPHTNYLHYPPPSMRHHFIFDDNTPMTESFNYTLSGNGSCRQSNRTLITRAGSRPTIISGDSMQTSNYIFEPDNNEVSQGDELPTKLPKPSTLTKIIRSASILRNNSLSKMRPKSLSRQSFADRSSNLFDNRFSGSQIPLLLSKMPITNSHYLERNHLMCTSDISHSKPLPKSAVLCRKNYNDRPYSHSGYPFLLNNKVISPTSDTYLEPTDSIVQSYETSDGIQTSLNKTEKNSDYMVYDHSQMSSNNPDTTCQSSILASSSDCITNEDDGKNRFSMISNNYYGLQGPNPRHSNCPFINISDYARNSINYASNESVYESIDDENVNLNTIDRRNIALPKPPTED